MPFDEKTKRVAKVKAAFRCCICRKPFVEVHHIMPEAEGGSDALDNAAPLCASCHDLYGGNPEKRRTIRQMRDRWWQLMQEREANLTRNPAMDKCAEILEDPTQQDSLHTREVVIYHVVFEHENFATAAPQIYKLVAQTQVQFPNRRRILYVDIDGHRDENGAWDHDMWELQRYFLLGFLMPFLNEVHMPLIAVQNNKFQRNDLFEKMEILDRIDEKTLKESVGRGIADIWWAERDRWIRLDET
jgi:hypothetical protein